MSGLLASVRSPAEAGIALAGGADIIDLKEPRDGALGALPAQAIAAAVALVGGRRPVSATIGDLPMQPALICDAVARTAALGVDYVKIGMFPGGRPEACLDALAPRAESGTALVALLFADCDPDFRLVDRAARNGFAGVMLDTLRKGGGNLRQCLDDRALQRFVERVHAHRMLAGLAGSLRLEDIPALLPLRADYLGFRGALCRGDRAGRLDPDRLSAVRSMLGAGDISSMATATAGAQSAALSQADSPPRTRLAKSR